MSDKRDPWERRDDEKSAAWAAFCSYRDLPPGKRTDLAAYEVYLRKCGKVRKKTEAKAKPSPSWPKWKRENQWEQRVAEFDRRHDAEYLAAHLDRKHKALDLVWLNLMTAMLRQTGLIDGADLDAVTRTINSNRELIRMLSEGEKPAANLIELVMKGISRPADRSDAT